jgi:hypothetical protein
MAVAAITPFGFHAAAMGAEFHSGLPHGLNGVIANFLTIVPRALKFCKFCALTSWNGFALTP